MEIVKVVEWLKKILKSRQDNVNEAITSDVKTLEDYKYLLGKLHAYKEIIQELTDLLKKQEQLDE
jgi:cell shape-determining protein MreC